MKYLILVAVAGLLAGCGGGGSDGAATTTAATTLKSELEGVWIASTDNHPTGSTCGLTSSGAYGERFTVNFNENRFTQKSEKCLILSGSNKGSYLLDASSSGTFAIGDISLQSSDPSMQMRALDMISMSTYYTSYNLVGKNLHIASPFQSYDGTSRDKRAFQIATTFDPTTRSLVSNPTYVKQ